MNLSRTWGLVGLLAFATLFLTAPATRVTAENAAPAASRNLVLWDTMSPIGDKLGPEERSTWRAVPSDLLLLEKNPPKASSDPGYYGREYSFAGDAVVETPALAVVFQSAKGRVTIYSKPGLSGRSEPSSPADWLASKTVDVSPLAGAGSASISHIEVVRNADDEVLLKVSFSHPGSPAMAGVFFFDRTGVVELKPAENLKRLRLSGPLQYGVVPGFIGDDLIFGGSEHSSTNTLGIPSENLFLGLLPGESKELVVTWPRGKQRMDLHFDDSGQGARVISSVDFDSDSQSLYLAVLSAPGIWHKETLKPENLEKDVRIEWKRPFPARWKTQLYEENVKTTFAFRDSKGEIWRGVPGSYVYPVWLSGDDAFYHLSKKVPPKGEALIYCLEGRDTPPALSMPADILKHTLGRQAAESILDLAGRKLRTHHRRGATGVRRACTCGCTEAIQAVFEAGEEVTQSDNIKEALEDMIYFVHRHVERINEYRQFADGVLKAVEQRRRSSPELKPFLDSLEEIVRQIPQECEVQKENMKTFEYADALTAKTMALTAKKEPDNLKAYMELLKAWREMGGAQDYVVAKCHTVTRNLCQAAGYGCGAQPAAMPLAEEIRARCRQVLRNPDGYEIWADY
jgi:hypothetical protein